MTPSAPTKPIRTLAAKELVSLFNSPATYVVAVVFLLLCGYLFISNLFQINMSTLDPFVLTTPIIFTFILPALTMRAFSEEYRAGTIEYLSSLPLQDHHIVLAKYLAIIGLLSTLLGFTLIYPAILLSIGRPDIGQMVGSYVAMLCLGSFYGAVGLWASSLTRNQVVAFIVSFFVCFSFYILARVANLFPDVVAGFVRSFSVEAHFEPLARGVLDSRDLLYWASGTIFFLVASLVAVQSRRVR